MSNGIAQYLDDNSSVPDRRRVRSYCLVAVTLILAYGLLRDSPWHSSVSFHTNLEVLSTLLAAVVGLLSLVRYYARRNSMFLYVGTGFLGTAFLDGYHATVTSTYLAPYLPSDLPSLVPWSWLASRVVLAFLLLIGAWAGRHEDPHMKGGRSGEILIYMSVGALTLAAFTFFAVVPLPRAYYPELTFHRPEEFLAAILFGAALVLSLRKGDWKRDAFEHWLIVSLVMGVVTQTVVMSLSSSPFDIEFDLAHLFKVSSYGAVLIGLMIGTYDTFIQVDRGALSLQAANDALRSSENRYRRLVDLLPVAIYIGCGGRIVFANPAAVRLFGAESDRDLIGRESVHLTDPESRQRILERRRQVMEDQTTVPFLETKHRRLDGSMVHTEAAAMPFRWKSEAATLVVLRDLSASKKTKDELAAYASELERSNSDLEQFAYVASHDLKAPLRSIDNLVQWIEEDLVDTLEGDTRENMDLLRNRVQRMASLLDDLLAYSRAGREQGVPEQVNPRDMIRGVVELIDPPEGFEVVVAGDMPTLMARRSPLETIFRNLIANAVKHHDRPEGRIVVAADEFRDRVRFSVTDDGPGIAPEYHQKIFDMFCTLKPRDQVEGSGMGLAIVRKLVERQGGTLTIESEKDCRGTRFVFDRLRTEQGNTSGETHDQT